MTTLKARANQAWAEVADDPAEVNYAFEHQRAAFEEGWETGYKTARAEITQAIEDYRSSPVRSGDDLIQLVAGECAAIARETGGAS